MERKSESTIEICFETGRDKSLNTEKRNQKNGSVVVVVVVVIR